MVAKYLFFLTETERKRKNRLLLLFQNKANFYLAVKN